MQEYIIKHSQKHNRKEANDDFMYRIVSDQSIAMMPDISTEEAKEKVKNSLGIEDKALYFIGLLNHGLIVKGTFETQYL